MPVLALILTLVWLVLVAGARGYLQARRGAPPPLAFRDPRGSPQWWSRVISAVGLGLAFAAPIADLLGMPRISPLDVVLAQVVGIGLWIAGVIITGSQVAMGASWRGDVDPEVLTELVTTGPFAVIRNPILTGTITTVLGLALLVPNLIAIAMLVAVVVALEIQVRLVEEPYLTRVHGEVYRRYAAGTGRFVPGIGRHRPSSDA